MHYVQLGFVDWAQFSCGCGEDKMIVLDYLGLELNNNYVKLW